VGGVAAGVAHRLGWDPLIVRGLLIISFFLGGLGLIAYGVGWALLPESTDGRIHLQEAIHGRFDPALIGAGLVTFSGMISNGPFFGFVNRFAGFGNFHLFHWFSGLFSGLFWTVALVLFIRWLVDKRRYHKFVKENNVSPVLSTSGADQVVMDDATTDDVIAISDFTEDEITASGRETIITQTVVADAPDEIEITNIVTEKNSFSDDDVTKKYEQRAAAAAAKAEARSKAYEEKAYYRQQRDIEKYQKAVERSRRPVTKGPGLVTLLLTFGSLFLVWTLAQAAIRGFMPVHVGATIANPVLWAGIALLVVGLGIFVSGIRGRKSGFLNGLAWLGMFAMIPLSILSAGVFSGQVAWSAGATDWIRPAATAQAIGSGVSRPINLANAELGFQGRFGSPVIDLTELDLSHATPTNPVTIPIEFSAGDVTVLLPPEARVEANVRLSAGTIYWQVTDPETGIEYNTWYDEDGYAHRETLPSYHPIRTTQTFETTVANPLRTAVYVASDAARLHGANLRLAISNGAGNVILRETALETAAAAELVNQ
jgi:phage shock protein PspC (stress-responsive transcriptional regulator)